MPRQVGDTHPQSSVPKPPEQHKHSVSRLKLGETLQPIRRTAQDLYLFRDNVAGRSALVHDSITGESLEGDGRQRRGVTKSPGHASRGSRNSQGSDESRHIKIHRRRRSGASVDGAGSPTHQHHFRKHLSTDISCHECGEINSPQWRPGPEGPGTLCNVCGLIYAKQESHRRRDKANPGKTGKHRER